MSAKLATDEQIKHDYVVNQLSTQEIADKYGYTHRSPVFNRIKKMGISTRTRKLVSNEQIKYDYEVLRLSIQEIADKYDYSGHHPVWIRLKNMGLRIRQHPLDDVPLTQIQKELVFGALLGDASVRKQGSGRCYLKIAQGYKQLDYVIWKHEFLSPHSKKINSCPCSGWGDKSHLMHEFITTTGHQFNEFYDLFHPVQKKIIPLDLSLLSPLAIAVWFMDDGSIDKQWKRIHFATCCFSVEDNHRILDYLTSTYGLKGSVCKVGWGGRDYRNVILSAKSHKDFCDLVSQYIIPSLWYKLGC